MNSTVCGNCEDHRDVDNLFSILFWHETSEWATLSSAVSAWPSSDIRTERSEVGIGLEWIVGKQITYRKHVLIRIRLQSSLGAGGGGMGGSLTGTCKGEKEILKGVTRDCKN